jgi:dTDP-4-amino-4,6-dideoxygalactose transaminase
MNKVRIPVWNTKIPDNTINFINDAFNNRSLSTGSFTKKLEEKLSIMHENNHCVCVNSGTSALKCIAIALDLKPNDEIIVPRRSWIATVNAFYELGLKIKLADIENNRSLISIESIRSLISKETKAIVTVNLNGRNSINSEMINLISEYKIPLIQDNAQSLLSSVPNKIKGIDTIQAYSFSIAKLLTTGQGGCVITSNEKIAEKVRNIRTQGLGNILRPLEWEVGSNYRISDLLSSIGLSQLELIYKKQKRLLEIYENYKSELSPLESCNDIPVLVEKGEFPLYSEFTFENRDELVKYLDSCDIETRPFFKDLDTAKYIKNFNNINFEESVFSKKGLTLPSGDGLTYDQQIEVISKIYKFYRN